MTTDRRAQVSSLDARDDLLAIADAWPDLTNRLGRGGNRAPDGMPKPASRTHGLVIDEHISELMAEVRDWTMFLIRQIITESTQPWTSPPGADTPTLLAIIARERIGHFTTHPDSELRAAFHNDTRDMRHKVTRAAYPDGHRTRTLDLPCEHDNCPGYYTTRARPDGAMPDLICSHNRAHRIPPSDWERRSWKIRHADNANNLLRAIRGVSVDKPSTTT